MHELGIDRFEQSWLESADVLGLGSFAMLWCSSFPAVTAPSAFSAPILLTARVLRKDRKSVV